MIDIQCENLIKSFQVGEVILNGLSFQVERGEHIGILGRNGAGKSTLFKILTGELDFDSGNIIISPGRRIGLISQIPVYPPEYTVEDVLRSAFGRLKKLADELDNLTARMEAGELNPEILKRYDSLSARFEQFGGWDVDTAVNKVANGLSIGELKRKQLFASLSGGEKTRVNLGRLILEDTDILLLDEPTNHLDLQATEWLENYTRDFHGTVLIISHDRYFLDRTVSRVIELENGKAIFYNGNYSFYAVEKERRYQENLKRYKKEQDEINRLSETARKMHEHNTELLHKRAFSIEKRIERMRMTEKPVKNRKLNAGFQEADFTGDEMLSLRGLSKEYDEKKLFIDLNFKITGGERIGLIGENGAGKSTLLKIIMGEEYPDAGRVRIWPQTRIAYLPQNMEFAHPDWNLVDNLISVKRDLSATSARNRLALYDFTGEDVFKPVGVLSGGEQSRLRLCMLMDNEINLLILDEPTNHLDIASREWIENAIEDYDGALLFVSHDRYFINRFATRIWELSDGKIIDYVMSFARYRELKARQERDLNQANENIKKARKSKKLNPARNDRKQPSVKRRLEICEREIGKLEEKIKNLDNLIEQSAADYENYEKTRDLIAQKDAAQIELNNLYQDWENLSEEAGET